MNGQGFLQSQIFGIALLIVTTVARGAGVEVPTGSMSGEIVSPHATTRSIEISVVSDQYNATKDFQNTGVYEMRVPGGDWNYEALTRLTLVDAANGGRLTRVYPGKRQVLVGENEHAVNDYKVTGNIRVYLTIKGDEYDSWAWSDSVRVGGSDAKVAGTSVNPRIAVVPGNDLRVVGQVSVSGRYAGFDETYTRHYDFRSEAVDVGDYETRDLHITIEHREPEPPCSLTNTCSVNTACEDTDSCPSYGNLRMFGKVRMENMSDFIDWRLNVPGGQWTRDDAQMTRFERTERVTSNRPVRPGVKRLRYRGMDGGTRGTMLDVLRGQYVQVSEGETVPVDLSIDTGVVVGKLNVEGKIPDWMDRIFFNSRKFNNLPGDERYSRSSRNRVAVTLAQPYNHNYLTPGDWMVGNYLSASARLGGDIVRWSRSGFNDASNRIKVLPGSKTEVTRNMCLGESVMRFRDKAGGVMRVEQVQGQFHEPGVGSASFLHRGTKSGETVEIQVNAPAADYTAHARLRMEDGTRVSPPPIAVPIQCGVRSCADPDAPRITILDTPKANIVTNAESIEIRGTVRDKDGVSDVSINGNPAEVQPAGGEGEFEFRYDLPLTTGENLISAIAVDGQDYGCFNERSVFVDRWLPEVRVEVPDSEYFYQPGKFMALDVVGEDRGYGYRLDVLVDGDLIASRQGRADDGFATMERVSDSLIFFSGDHTVTARVTDRAGNSAHQSITLRGNRPPVADAGMNDTIEATGRHTVVTLDGTGSHDPDGDRLTYRWASSEILLQGVAPEVSLPVGTYNFELTVTDEGGEFHSDSVTVEVVDSTPPEIRAKELGAALWPPNHRMVHVASVVSVNDLVDGSPQSEVFVTSDEAAQVGGSGHTGRDWEVVKRDGGYDIFLRAERSGRADGRVYTVNVVAVDGSGNRSEWRENFHVMHDKRNPEPIRPLATTGDDVVPVTGSDVSAATGDGGVRNVAAPSAAVIATASAGNFTLPAVLESAGSPADPIVNCLTLPDAPGRVSGRSSPRDWRETGPWACCRSRAASTCSPRSCKQRTGYSAASDSCWH